MTGCGQPRGERRRYPRYPAAEQATILVGAATPAALVFGQTLNWSRGGACLKAPSRFAVQIGEQFSVLSAPLGPQRSARVVDVTPGGVHFAFEQDLV